jgi:dihydrofolate synthase/folylpolyglutamate synthase
MLGAAQADNAALAALCVKTIFPDIAPVSLARGIETAWLPGRGELLRAEGDVAVVLDGAHTPHSVRRLRDTFTELFGTRGVLLFGSVLGKDHETMAEALVGSFERVIVSRPGTFKDSDPPAVATAFERLGAVVSLIPEPEEAIKTAIAAREGRPVLVTGSFYLLGEVRRALRNSVDGFAGDFV